MTVTNAPYHVDSSAEVGCFQVSTETVQCCIAPMQSYCRETVTGRASRQDLLMYVYVKHVSYLCVLNVRSNNAYHTLGLPTHI